MRASPLLLLLFSLPTLACDVNVGFTPGDTALKNILTLINSTQTSLDVEAYSFTSKDIALALYQAKKRGVTVRIMADREASKKSYNAVTWLAHKDIPVRLNGNYAIMHNKVIIADSKNVETGSFNFTASANRRNAENNLVLTHCPSAANAYTQEFNRLWNESKPY